MPGDIPELTPVTSSNITHVGHDGQHVYVKYRNGDTWRYEDFSRPNYDEMINSGSVGTYVHQFVKPNHKGTKVTP